MPLINEDPNEDEIRESVKQSELDQDVSDMEGGEPPPSLDLSATDWARAGKKANAGNDKHGVDRAFDNIIEIDNA
jgi:hypothetical protein